MEGESPTLIDSSFQGMNKFFVLLFDYNGDRLGHKEIKDCNVKLFNQPIRNNKNISKS